MLIFSISIIAILALIFLLTYPSKSDLNRGAIFIKNIALIFILYINISVAYAILEPLLSANVSGVLDSISNFLNEFVAEPFSEVLGISLNSIVDVITFLPDLVGEYFYVEMSIHDGNTYFQILIISISVGIISTIDVIAKILFYDKESYSVNHKILAMTNFALTVITGIALLLSVVVLLPYYYEINEIIVVSSDGTFTF